FNGFTGAVTGAISGGIDNAKKLGEGAKLVAEAVSGFIIGTGEDAARQAFVEGKKEVNLGQSVMKGIKNAALAVAVPLIIKGGQAVVNKIKTQGVNTAVEEVVEKAVKETSEEVTEEVAEKGAKSLANNSDEMISKGLSNTKTKYAYNMIENPGPLAEVRGNPASNFISGKYNIETLDEDIILYRSGKEGGLTIPGKEQNALGQWFTREPAESVAKVRIDSAVKAQWIDPKTGVLTGTSTIESTYAIKIPKGTIIYEGPVGYQGGIYLGGENCNQIFVSEPWKIHDVKPLSETPIK
ncbi:MAG: hypothetical protein ACTTKP_08000, partial [Catonella sp.]|uniref:hypothetical protein n=1 Tax=Catonella sp. TaxID=2382125 RepID=UPI003FA0ED3A